jgi:hypothetical protein
VKCILLGGGASFLLRGTDSPHLVAKNQALNHEFSVKSTEARSSQARQLASFII